ncbi:MAG: winged helix-turn-helix transcriptional regulator [Firmicutes bacterium]|nr:winged helix-turn-helix transcriptional regulator [Bacillota bacterium]
MKSFAKEINITAAQQILDVVPIIMRTIRAQMRLNREADLSVPQFRALNFIRRHRDASLSAIADHLGLALPSVSKLVDGLVAKGLVTRSDNRHDRRRLALGLTPAGQAVLASARVATLSYLANALANLSPEELRRIVTVMETLKTIFGSSDLTGSDPHCPSSRPGS